MVEPLTGGIISVIVLLLFLLVKVPIFVCIGLSGLVGLFLIEGASGTFLSAATIAFDNLFAPGLLAVPVFIMMGNLISRFGIGADLYDCVYKNLGRLPGGLATHV